MASPFAAVLGGVSQASAVVTRPRGSAAVLGSVTQAAPVLSTGAAVVVVTFHILLEAGGVLLTEASDSLRTE